MICEKTKDFPKAREAYERLISLKPDYAPGLNNLAYLYAEHFDLLEKAQDLAQKARSLQSTDPGIADTLGWILYKKGDYQQALSLLAESAQKLPENPEVQFHLGMAKYMMGEKDALERPSSVLRQLERLQERKKFNADFRCWNPLTASHLALDQGSEAALDSNPVILWHACGWASREKDGRSLRCCGEQV
jgi:Flp pilus assembly protein TadD